MQHTDIDKILAGLAPAAQGVNDVGLILGGLQSAFADPATGLTEPIQPQVQALSTVEENRRLNRERARSASPIGELTIGEIYQANQRALLGIPRDAPVLEPPTFTEFFISIGDGIMEAGDEALKSFYKGTERLLDTAFQKLYGVEDERPKTLHDKFVSGDFGSEQGLGPDDAPYSYAGLRSLMGIAAGPFHLIGGVGDIINVGVDEGVAAAGEATKESVTGLLSVFNPFADDLDGSERFHRSLNLAFAGAGGLKGFKTLRTKGAVKKLVKNEGLTKPQARLIVKEIDRGLKEIDKELGTQNSFETALDDLTQSRLRDIAGKIDPTQFLFETLKDRVGYVPPVRPTPDMNRGQRLTGTESPLYEGSVRVKLDLTEGPVAMRNSARRLKQLAEEAQVEAVRTGNPDQFAAAEQLNGKANFLNEQARIIEIANEAPLDVPNVRFRKVQPALNGDGPGPGRHAPDDVLGEPVDVPPKLGEGSETGRITVDPISEGTVVQDGKIWKDFFKKLNAKLPRTSGRTKRGRFSKDQSTIVVRSLRNSSTVAHEAGHQFNEIFDLSKGVPESELLALVGDLDVPGRNLADEAAAEFIRGMMVNPKETISRAPTMARRYQAAVPEYVRSAVEEAGTRIRTVLGQDPKALTLSQIRLTTDTPSQGLGEIVRDAVAGLDTTRPYKTPLNRILQTWIGDDDLGALLSAQEYIKEVAGLVELVEEADAGLLAARHRYVNNQVMETVAGGLRDQYGQVLMHNIELGLLQQTGRKKIVLDGAEIELSVFKQIDPPRERLAGQERILVDPDGKMYDFDGRPLGVVGTAEPLTLKWVLQPLKKQGATVANAFEEFIVQGVSDRALELYRRKQRDAIPGVIDKLIDADPNMIEPILKESVKDANLAYKGGSRSLTPGLDDLTIEALMDVLNGFEEGNVISEIAVHGVIKSVLDVPKWSNKQARGIVRRFKQDISQITGAGRGLIDDASIARKVVELTDPALFDATTMALGRYRSYSNALLRYLVDTGMLDEAGYASITEGNRSYFDLGRVMDELSDKAEVPRYHREELKALTGKAKGSLREIESPVVNLMVNTEQAIRLAERNRMLNSFVDPMRNTSDPVASNLLASVAEKVEGPGANTVKVFKDGKVEHWKLEEGVFEALKPDQALSGIPKLLLNIVSFPRNLLQKGITMMPNFVVRNAIRDFMDARIKGHGISMKEAGRAMIASESEAGFYDYFGGGIAIWDDANLRKGWHQLQKEVIRQIDLDPATQRTYYEPTSQRLKVNDKGRLAFYNKLRAGAERAPRLAEYKIALDQARRDIKKANPSWSPERIEYNAHLRAGKAARDIIDFARGAKIWKGVNRVIPFVNARIQGFSSSIIAIRRNWHNPQARKALALRILTTMGSLSAAEYGINKMAGTEEAWRDQPAYLKDMYWLFPTPEPNMWIRIPKPFEWGVMASVFPRIVYNDWDGFLTDEGSIVEGSLFRALSPVAYDDLLFGPFQTVIELTSNYDQFRRTNIIPIHEEGLDLSLRKGTKNASLFSRKLTGALDAAGNAIGLETGIDPRNLDHAIRGFTGNAGQALTTFIDEPNPESIPRYINAIIGLTTTDGSSNSAEVRKAMKYAASVGITGVFSKEFDVLADARRGDPLTGGDKVWQAKRAILEKSKRINQLIEEKTAGKTSQEQLEIIKDIVKDFR